MSVYSKHHIKQNILFNVIQSSVNSYSVWTCLLVCGKQWIVINYE